MKPLKILLADDHQIVLDGLRSLLETEESIEILNEAHTGNDVVDYIRTMPGIELVILDINMPGMDGIDCTKAIKSLKPDVKVLIMSMYEKVEFIKELKACGADGYILKNAGKKVLMEAIRTVADGDDYFKGKIARLVSEDADNKRITQDASTQLLTKREIEIVRLIAQEQSTQEIADNLFLSTHTIDTHRKNILSKLEVRNTVGITRYAIKTGIVKGFDL